MWAVLLKYITILLQLVKTVILKLLILIIAGASADASADKSTDKSTDKFLKKLCFSLFFVTFLNSQLPKAYLRLGVTFIGRYSPSKKYISK